MHINTRQVDGQAAVQDNSNSSEEFGWLVAQTVGTFLGLLAIVLAVATILIERIRRVRADDERRFTSNPSILGCFHAPPVSKRKSLRGKKTDVLHLPTITGLIEIGDKRAWTSSVLDLMVENHSEATWVKLYESIATSIVSNPTLLEEAKKSDEPIPTFMNRVKKAYHQGRHVASVWEKRRGVYESTGLINVHRDLPAGGNNQRPASGSPKEAAKTGLSRLTPTWIVREKACVGVTREEIAALAIIMGVSFPRTGNPLYLSGVGGFGLSIDISHADTTWSMSLVQGSRLPRHAASMGSGYTTTMAKHLACGSVPFAQNEIWILSVYLTDDVYTTIQNGGKIVDKRAFGGDSLEFLRRLPGEKRIDAFYGTEKASASNTGVGDILHADGKKAGTWSQAVTGIAFGGLVPQANPNIVSAVKFTVGGANLDGCIESLENLIDELHGFDAERGIFGDNVTARCAEFGHSFVNYTFPSEHSNTPDAAAIFSRYSNLVERVAALTVGHPNTTAQSQVNGASPPIVTIDSIFEHAAAEIQKAYISAVSKLPGSSSSVTNIHSQDLGALLRGVIHRVKNGAKDKNRQPIIQFSDCSAIIRCVLAAWAFTVPLIEVRQSAGNGSLNINRSASWGNKVPNEIVLSNLPPVSAFC